MRTVIHRIVRVLLAAGLIGAGVYAAAVTVSGPAWERTVARVAESRDTIFWGGLGAFFLGLLFVLSGIPRKRKDKFLTLEGENGTVSISTRAISDYLLRLQPEFPSVTRLWVDVLPKRDAVDLRLRVRVKEGAQVHELCDKMQDRVCESMVNGLGIAKVRRVEVSVTDVVSEHRPR